jgi:hypothetical protein
MLPWAKLFSPAKAKNSDKAEAGSPRVVMSDL